MSGQEDTRTPWETRLHGMIIDLTEDFNERLTALEKGKLSAAWVHVALRELLRIRIELEPDRGDDQDRISEISDRAFLYCSSPDLHSRHWVFIPVQELELDIKICSKCLLEQIETVRKR